MPVIKKNRYDDTICVRYRFAKCIFQYVLIQSIVYCSISSFILELLARSLQFAISRHSIDIIFPDILFTFQYCISCAHLGISGGGHVQSAVAYHIGGRGKGNGRADKEGGNSKLHID